MAHDESELRQAEQLNKVVGNIVAGDHDLFEGADARNMPESTMELIDLATFIIPAKDGTDDEFVRRMCALAVRESHELSEAPDSRQHAASRTWSRLLRPILETGLAAAAFFASLFMEPVCVSRGVSSIDTPSRRWYNYRTGKYTVSSAQGDIAEQVLYIGFSDGGSGYRVAACR